VQTGAAPTRYSRRYKFVFGCSPATRQSRHGGLFKSLQQPLPQTYSVIWTNDASPRPREGVRLACGRVAGLKGYDGYELPAKPTDVSSVLGRCGPTRPDLLVCVMHDQNSLLVARQMVASTTSSSHWAAVVTNLCAPHPQERVLSCMTQTTGRAVLARTEPSTLDHLGRLGRKLMPSIRFEASGVAASRPRRRSGKASLSRITE